MTDHLASGAVHPTVLAEQLREQAISTASIARMLGVAVTVVQRWFDLIDELAREADHRPVGEMNGPLSTDRERGSDTASNLYKNVRP